MTLRISGKNVDIGQALREHIDGRVGDAVGKYFDGGVGGHVTLEREGSGFRTECVLALDTGITLQSSGRSMDPYGSFDQAAERIEKRLRRYKRRLKDHNNGEARGEGTLPAQAYVIEALDEDEEPPADFNPVVVAETSQPIRTMTVGMAVMELDLTGVPVVVFRNAGGSDSINVVYRREDGNIGWIDPALLPSRS